MAKDNIVMSGVQIAFRNFEGKEGKYNPAGRRNFCMFIDDPELGHRLEEDGWNVRWLTPRDETEQPRAYLQVGVNFDNHPPHITLVSRRGKTALDESTVNILDWAEIANVDLVVRPYNWELNGKTGVKAYLKEMWVTIREDEFADKYEDLPTSAADAIGGCGMCEVCDGSCGNGRAL